MAHDVLIAGALFPDVPSVQFPDSQQQWHSFTDVSDTTAAAADVAQGKQFYDAAGVLTQGTASGGGGDDGSYKAAIERSGNITSFPSDLTKVGDYAFYGYAGTFPTSLPSGVTTIGVNAFYNCANLALTSLPSSLTTIGANAFSGCASLALTSLPSSLKSIASSAFYGCTSLTTLTCEGAITSLASSAFSRNSSLTRVEFPNMSISSLGTVFGSTGATTACQQLEVADMGSAKAVAANAFNNCYKLQTLVLRRSDAICTLSNVSAFTNTPMRGYSGRTGTIYVPSALIDTYKTATNWKTIYDAGHLTFAAIEGSAWEL